MKQERQKNRTFYTFCCDFKCRLDRIHDRSIISCQMNDVFIFYNLRLEVMSNDTKVLMLIVFGVEIISSLFDRSFRHSQEGFFMMLMEAKNIKFSYGDKTILDFEHFSIYENDRIGLVGSNGAGKTTLLQILTGELEPEEGKVEVNCEIAYFKQFDEVSKDDITCNRELKEFHVTAQAREELISGGEKTRVRLASALSKNAHILFADEPTSNLDLQGVKLLGQKFKQQKTMILISHDRDLLDAVCNRIIEVRDTKLFVYHGNYSEYEKQRQENYEREWAEYEAYTDEKDRLERIYKEKAEHARAIGERPTKLSPAECRLRNFLALRPFDVKQKSMQSSAKAVQKRIEHMEVKDKPKEQPKIRPDFRLTNPPENKIIIEARNLNYAYGDHVIFEKAEFAIKNHKRVALVGDNGSGKTTLFNLIKNGYEGIRIVPKAKIGYFYQGFDNLDYSKTVLQNVMQDSIQKEEVARMILARLLLKESDIKKQAGVLSGGEKIKLAFAKLFISDANVLILDEPTNFLDLPSVEAIEELFSSYEGTLVFVSHDKRFINAIATELLMLKGKKLIPFEGTYDAYEKSQKRSTKADNSSVLLTAAQMRMTSIMARFSDARENREKLEQEYEETRLEIKRLTDKMNHMQEQV